MSDLPYQITRTAVTMVGGAYGGPLGSVASGATFDVVVSIFTGRPRGYVDGFCCTIEELRQGRFPVEGLWKILKPLALDLYVGASFSWFSAQVKYGHVLGKIMTSSSGRYGLYLTTLGMIMFMGLRQAASKGSAQQGAPNRNPPGQPSSGQSERSSTRSSDGAGGSTSGAGDEPPPGGDRNNQRPQCLSDPESPLNAFLRLLSVASLEDVTMGRPAISLLYEIDDGNVVYLDRVVGDLSKSGYLDLVVKVTQLMFDVMYVDDIGFLNLLSLLEFVAVYIGEYLDDKLEQENQSESLDDRKETLIDEIWDGIDAFSRRVLNVFNLKQREVQLYNERLFKPFRDVFAAAYHYYKHRILHDGRILSVAEYFRLIDEHLERARQLALYDELLQRERELLEERNRQTQDQQEAQDQPTQDQQTQDQPTQDQPTQRRNPIRGLVYEMFHERYGRRFRIVLKIQDGRLVLSSALFVGRCYKDDVDGKIIVRRL